ncbi:MAG: thioredoxin family protein [Hyphomicrobiaceae bacterium]|nr:thioredoxin family protein [Hyphomicrobiaceae bacterium]
MAVVSHLGSQVESKAMTRSLSILEATSAAAEGVGRPHFLADRKRALQALRSMRRMPAILLAALLAVQSFVPAAAADAAAQELPPAVGAEVPAVPPLKGDDGIYHQPWFVQSFFDLKEDFAEAKAQGKRFAVIFEQRGCSYCTKMHTDVLSKRYINDYVRENFAVVQFDMWGSRDVTDFDGTKMSEKEIAERWGVLFTPTVVFFKEAIDGAAGQWGQPLEVARMNLGIGAGTFYDMFTWIRAKVYERDRNFQRFHLARHAERERMTKEKAGGSGATKDKVN